MVQTEGTSLTPGTDSVNEGFLPLDSVVSAADSLASAENPRYGIILTPSEEENIELAVKESNIDISVVTGLLFLLFFIIALRFRNNGKYMAAIRRNILEVKERHNVFDDTVRETSFVVVLNLMWCFCTGIILFRLICFVNNPLPENSFLPHQFPSPGVMISICTATAIVYSLFMAAAYTVVGNVFANGPQTVMWLKGYLANQGVLGFLFFPLALLFLCYPANTELFLWIALALFISSKIIFIWKGMRIFFTRSSSWVLFLYYLCSLEIVPLILAYLAALLLCSIIS